MTDMKVSRGENANRRRLGDEVRTDYEGDYFKVVITDIPPGHIQNLHHHDVLYDVAYVLSGEVVAVGGVGAEATEVVLSTGDLVEFEPSVPHTFRNDSASMARMLTLKIAAHVGLGRQGFDRLIADDWHGD